MISMERGKYYVGGKVYGLELPTRVFPCKTPAEVRSSLPANVDVVAFQCRNPVHKAHYELFTRALDADNVGSDGVVLVHPTCGPTLGRRHPGRGEVQNLRGAQGGDRRPKGQLGLPALQHAHGG